MASSLPDNFIEDLRAQMQQSQARLTTPVGRPLPTDPDDLLSLPLDPERAASVQADEALMSGSMQASKSSEVVGPFALQLNTLSRKRREAPGEAESIVRRIHRRTNLSQGIQDKLALYASAPDLERNIMEYCAVLQLHERIDLIQPVDAPFELINGGELKTQLEKYKCVVMTSHHTPGYLIDAPRLIIGVLSRNPSWGLTKAISDSPPKIKVITKYARTRCSDSRKEFKRHIKESVGKPSAGSNSELEKRENAVNVEALVKKCVGNDKSYIVITAEICARFAYLRYIYVKTNGSKLWAAVDKGLETVRSEFPTSRPGGLEAQTRFFASVLSNDIALYGYPTSPQVLKTVAESDAQHEVLLASEVAATIDIDTDAGNSESNGRNGSVNAGESDEE